MFCLSAQRRSWSSTLIFMATCVTFTRCQRLLKHAIFQPLWMVTTKYSSHWIQAAFVLLCLLDVSMKSSPPLTIGSLSLANKTTKQDHWVYERIGDKIAKGGKENYQTGLLKISEGNWRTAKRPLKEIDVWWCDQLWFLLDARYKIFFMESMGWFAKM